MTPQHPSERAEPWAARRREYLEQTGREGSESRDPRFDELDRAIAAGQGDVRSDGTVAAVADRPLRPPLRKRTLEEHRQRMIRRARRVGSLPQWVEGILLRICFEREIQYGELVGKHRDATLVEARTQVARELRERGLSMPRIGRVLHRHHTTILHLLYKRKAPAPVPYDPNVPDLSGEWAI